MNTKVRGLDFNYDENNTVIDVNARFEMTDSAGSFINGNIKISKAEYESSDGLSDIAVIVKAKLKDKIDEL